MSGRQARPTRGCAATDSRTCGAAGSFSVHASIPSPSVGEPRIDTDFDLTCIACVGLSLARLLDPAVKLHYHTLLFTVGGLSDWGTNGTTVIGIFGWNMSPFVFASYSMAALHVDDKSSVGASTDVIDIIFMPTAFRTLGIPDGVIDYAEIFPICQLSSTSDAGADSWSSGRSTSSRESRPAR